MCLPPDGQLEYPVWSFDEDEGFLSAAVEGGSVYVNELVAHFQFLAQGCLSSILDLRQRQELVGRKNGTLGVEQKDIQSKTKQ